ncbi:PQQ-binding-like beta-propeller repeat protein [Streptomyces sp. NPDC048604]|uniref:protein kinase domain-containing protein n=1 Tax=Streptomyces sp. NPDC048604 TaxID=3365578 RepID=UPI0037228E5B
MTVPTAPTPPASTPPASTSATALGASIGPYRVIRELGAGGMGRVYLAASRSGRAVAVKVVRPELAADPGFRRRFRAEVDAARAVGGVFTAPVVDADPDGPQPWLATAYIPGPSLTAAVGAHGPMPEPTLRVLGAGLAEALAAVHRAGLIHRDLKPSNILLAADGPRVIDFGISRAVDGTVLTADGQIIGSPGYMSPEQTTGAELTPAGDVFSLGAVLAFAATGEPPFGTGQLHALLYRTAHEPPRLDGVPPALYGLVAACLDKDPARRPSVPELQVWLRPRTTEGWLGAVQQQVDASEADLRDQLRGPLLSRRRLLGGGAVLAAAAAAGGVTWWLRQPDTPDADPPQLLWTATLPQPGMSLLAHTPTTLLVAGKTSGGALDRGTGKLLWKDLSGQNTAARSDDRRVYTLRTDGRVHALDLRTGAELWAAAPAGADAPRLEYADGSLLVTATGGDRVHGVDAASGTVKWQADVAGLLSVDGAAKDGGLVVWGSSAHTSGTAMLSGYHVLDPKTGARRWSEDLVMLYAPPSGEALYGLDGSMNLVARGPSDGAKLWSRPTSLPPTNSQTLLWKRALQLDGDTLFCYPGTGANGSTGGLLAAFDPKTGAHRWTVRTAARGERGWARSGDTVCVLDAGALRGLDVRTGAARWTAGSGLVDLQLIGAARDMYLATGAKGLYAFHAATGAQLWHHPVTGGPAGAYWSTALTPDRLFAGHSGTLLAFGL